MALPTKTEVSTLDYVDWATGYATFDAKAAVNSFSLDIADWATGYAVSGAGAASSYDAILYVKVSGTWQQAKALHIKNSGSWASSDDFRVKVSGTWEGGTIDFP